MPTIYDQISAHRRNNRPEVLEKISNKRPLSINGGGIYSKKNFHTREVM